jgi:hypothetical protein
VALTLVGASFDAGGPKLTLGFDRAIDVSGLVAGQLVVDDGTAGARFGGTGAGALVDPTTVEVDMGELAAMAFPDTRLLAGSGTGIVAADDGGTWGGAAGLLLPFP